jgi:segregation and condensation protein A
LWGAGSEPNLASSTLTTAALSHPATGHALLFVQGQRPEGFNLAIEAALEIDVIEFLWASMALFDDGCPGPDVSETYRPRWRKLYSIPEARARILRLLAETPDGLPLEQLLREEPVAAGIAAEPGLRKRAAWTSTFIAGLELAKQGHVALAQEGDFTAIHVNPAPTEPPAWRIARRARE